MTTASRVFCVESGAARRPASSFSCAKPGGNQISTQNDMIPGAKRRQRSASASPSLVVCVVSERPSFT